MREGDKWKITFPAALGYGKHGSPKIPPGSTIEVEAELMKVDN